MGCSMMESLPRVMSPRAYRAEEQQEFNSLIEKIAMQCTALPHRVIVDYFMCYPFTTCMKTQFYELKDYISFWVETACMINNMAVFTLTCMCTYSDSRSLQTVSKPANYCTMHNVTFKNYCKLQQ